MSKHLSTWNPRFSLLPRLVKVLVDDVNGSPIPSWDGVSRVFVWMCWLETRVGENGREFVYRGRHETQDEHEARQW